MFNSLICYSKPLILCSPYASTWNEYEQRQKIPEKKLLQVTLIFANAGIKNKMEQPNV